MEDNTNNIFFLVDLEKLETENIKKEDGTTEERKYICSYPNFNIYYLSGLTLNGKKYHSITSKIDERIVKNITGKINEELTLSQGVNLTILHNTSAWTNKLGIVVKMENYQEGYNIYCNDVQIENGQEINSSNDLKNLIGEDYSNTLVFTVKSDGKEVAREEIDISNFDDVPPIIGEVEINDEYNSMKLLKINGLKDQGKSGLKEIKYEVITEENINSIEELLNSESLIKHGKYVDLRSIKLDNDGKGTTMLKLPTDFLGICFIVVDNALNISTPYIYSSNRVMCTITTPESSPTTAKIITYNLTFNEEVEGFEQSDIIVENGEIESFSGSGAEYTVKVKSIEGKKVVQTLTVPENVCTGTSQINKMVGNLASSLTLVVDRIVKPQGILLSKTNCTMNENENLNLSATVLPINSLDKSVTWSSNDESIATVDQNGKVTAISEGETSIIAKCSNFPNITAKCKIVVKPVIAKIGEKYYTDLQFAFDDASTDSLEYSTIEILRDFSVDSEKELSENKYAVLDLKGYTISTKDAYMTNYFLYNEGSLKITSSVDGGMILSDNARYIINNRGNLEITNATIKNTGANNYCVYSSVSSNTVLDSGKLETTNSSGIAVYLANNMATFTQNGGEIAGNILNNGVYNLNNGTTKQISNNGTFIVEGGIISETFFQYTDTSSCIVKDGTIAGINITKGTLTLGEDDETVSTTSPQVTSLGVNISDTAQFNFYDGIIRGNENAIVGKVTKKPAKHYMKKTKNSTTSIETTILIPGNSVDDIAYFRDTYVNASWNYEMIYDGNYSGMNYSSVTSGKNRLDINFFGGDGSNYNMNFYSNRDIVFYDKDYNILTDIHNDNNSISIEIYISSVGTLANPYTMSTFISELLPSKYLLVTADEKEYVCGLRFCSSEDSIPTPYTGVLPEVFSQLNFKTYAEKYQFQGAAGMSFWIYMKRNDGTNIAVREYKSEGGYSNMKSGDGITSNAQKAWSEFSSFSDEFWKKSVNYGG